MLRRISLWPLLILLLVIPVTSPAQTRFFDRGDSGLIPSFDLIGTENSGHRFDWVWGAHVTYTFKGLVDVGAGFELAPYSEDNSLGPQYLLANAVLMGPKDTRGFGLEINGRYTNWTREKHSYFYPAISEERDRSYEGGLRGYFRNAPASLIVGLGGLYRYQEHQTFGQSGEVLFGHDWGEVGFTLDGHFLAWRLVHFSLLAEYAQNKEYSFLEGWEFTVIMSAGVLFGLNPEPGGDFREP